MKINDFMLNLLEKIKDKGVKENTASLYINNLYTLNNKKPFTSLSFLKKINNIESIIQPYAETTKNNFFTAILSVLALFKDTASYKKLYEKYLNILNERKDKDDEKTKYTKNEKQNENWIEWDEVNKLKNDYLGKIKEFENNKQLTKKQFETLLQYLVLCLYTSIPPRRNKDYQECYIVKCENDKLPTTKNYYCLDTNKFIFNVYKTNKTYGQQTIKIDDNDEMLNAMRLWLKFHPLMKGRYGKNKQTPLLVNHSGIPFTSINSITRILNKVFKKNVGASMLRHIYLSSKYGDVMEDMEQDAEDMAHSTNQAQNTYIKTK
jgi:hypothetical protein